jgi:hypothetical protein
MPNLTIKPVAAAGNKVIIQDQAGNTRLQTDDAGITLTTPNLGTPSAVTLTNATFPAGKVLQMKHGTYKTQTYLNSGPHKIIDISITAKAANSTWLGEWSFYAAQDLDAHGWNLYASIGTGTPDNTSSSQIWDASTNGNQPTMINGNDLGNITSAHETGYSFGSTHGKLSTTSSGSTGGSFAKGAVVRCAFWVTGNSQVWVNRSVNRATQHESGITSLTVWEIAT